MINSVPTDSMLNPPHWKDYWHLHNTALNGKRTIQDAYNWLESNYTGSETRKAIEHQCFCYPSDSDIECKFRILLKDAIKLGYGTDLNFERVFR